MRLKRTLLIPLDEASNGYPYGVEAVAPGFGTEIHGTFTSAESAGTYARALLREFGDYESVKVVRIETPEVTQ